MKQKEDSLTLDMYTEEAPPDAALQTIAQLAVRQLALEQEVARTETRLQELQRELRAVQETELPDAMLAAGCSSYRLTSGASISIKDGISASLAEGKRASACEWLRSHGFGDIVTDDLTLNFARGQAEAAHALLDDLHARGLNPVIKTNVNTATLKALIREQMQAGREMPLDLFGAYVWRKAIITPGDRT